VAEKVSFQPLVQNGREILMVSFRNSFLIYPFLGKIRDIPKRPRVLFPPDAEVAQSAADKRTGLG